MDHQTLEVLSGSEVFRLPIGVTVETTSGDFVRITQRDYNRLCVAFASTRTGSEHWYMLYDDGTLTDEKHIPAPGIKRLEAA